MKAKDFIKRFLLVFAVGLIANSLVTMGWNYFIKDVGAVVDWETSFRTALIFGIVIPLASKLDA